jgi:hypothetical protein
MLKIPHCTDNRLISGGKVVSLRHRPHFIPQKHYYFCHNIIYLWNSACYNHSLNVQIYFLSTLGHNLWRLRKSLEVYVAAALLISPHSAGRIRNQGESVRVYRQGGWTTDLLHPASHSRFQVDMARRLCPSPYTPDWKASLPASQCVLERKARTIPAWEHVRIGGLTANSVHL